MAASPPAFPLRNRNRPALPPGFGPCSGKENNPIEPIARFKAAMSRVRLADGRVKRSVARLHLAKKRADMATARARAMLNRLKAIAAEGRNRTVEKCMPRLHAQMERSGQLSDHMNKIGDRVLRNLSHLEKETARAWAYAARAEEVYASRAAASDSPASMGEEP
ncbi:uncharacterized protein LOC129593895 [Paramacrobiotus metropolitanus]|uniref:uncharacterized protein LOC129593895 n=1 Tax=Paramacrobiotus metropolitanus TaxID=2943436 RepID=UPI002445C6EB|nr:uncharacterized protein LOC129593895 [Paramacrobiotus metropolitanus]XP_055346368.1 uncharacterized protein LOC129593895 [Paramacrobiotus metropolitanus]XP_055346369.1 uncharacterized protein LOC129593895 [Paramacrobiotus metropolitanus]XP_055346370.1 uncharacterized protein LOC129593895 [Paramacrobiotus metropolitanus]XP_055346371.1 uncharacterized protein LOC129593895 [Paramacrobiotus metropolitanus]XP_055346372.1 uncharacterized protein LOC129593895 [Paramacrobiotus metropolitanus]